MLIEHEGRRPKVHPSAYVAPTAVLSGNVQVGPGCQVLFGAVLTDEGGPVELGESTIVVENAVLRGTRRDPVRIGAHVLVGPGSYLVGATVDDDCFLATGGTVFNGAPLGRGCEARINATCTCAPCCPRARWSRSAGSPSVTLRSSRRPSGIRTSGQRSASWTSVATSGVCPARTGGSGRRRGQMTEITRLFGRLLAQHTHDLTIGEHGRAQADRRVVSSESVWEPLVVTPGRSASGSGCRSRVRPRPKGAVRSAAPTSAPRRVRSYGASRSRSGRPTPSWSTSYAPACM